MAPSSLRENERGGARLVLRGKIYFCATVLARTRNAKRGAQSSTWASKTVAFVTSQRAREEIYCCPSCLLVQSSSRNLLPVVLLVVVEAEIGFFFYGWISDPPAHALRIDYEVMLQCYGAPLSLG